MYEWQKKMQQMIDQIDARIKKNDNEAFTRAFMI